LNCNKTIANALIHGDYSSLTENAYISVYMYQDRIEIISPGALYGMNKIEKLGTATIMESRNPNIIRILEEKRAVIENRHSGIPTMKREMEEYGLPEPEFYEERGSFKVIFRNGVVNNSGQQSDTQTATQMATQIKYKDIRKKVLNFCIKPKTLEEIRKFTGIKTKSVFSRQIIKPLVEKVLLDYTNKNSINARNQKYVTIKK